MPKQPVLIENYLETGESPYGLLMVHQGRAITCSPPLVNVIGAFCDDGQGGLIAAAKTRGERFGYINANGDWLVAPELLDARTFGSGKLARYCQDGLWGFMGLDGKPAITPRWTEVGNFQYGPAAVAIAPGIWRYIDEEGAFAFDGEFSDAGSFGANGLAPARTGADDAYGYLDRSGAWAITPRFALAQEFSVHGVASAAAAEGKHGLIDASGAWIVQPVHQEIRPFNADGLAYCSGRKGGAYLDASGNRFFEEARDLSGRMVDGVLRTSFDTYMTRDGELHVDGGLCWGGDLNEYGFALALTWSGRNRVDRNGDQLAGWGIARTDGSFTPAPPNAIEPFPVDPEYDEFLDPEANTPLVVFVGNDNDLLMLDGEARIAFRLRIEQGSDGQATALYDDQARLLWTSPASGTLAMPDNFFFPPDDWFYDELDSADQLEELARTMLRETEHKLHQLARDPHFDIDGGEEEEEREHDDYERDDDDDDEEMLIAKTIRTRRRLSHFYNNEEVAGLYSCLGYLRNERQTEVEHDLDTRLEALFGPSDKDPDFVGKPHNMYFAAWSFKLDTPVTDDDAVAPEANRLWLATSWTGDTGDGDEWGNVWLTCAPSIETLELALEARAALDAVDSEEDEDEGEEDEEEDEDEEDDEDEDEEDEEDSQPAALAPQDNSDALLELVTRYAHGIDQIPEDQVTAELADAAVAAHTDALQYLPARFQTEQRLEELIRRKLSTARAIPARCMTPAGLALARSLYGGDRDWDWHDQRRSAECTRWDQNSLSQRWGALIDTAYCERALLGGARYFYVPVWLRTPQLEAFALKADIDNLPYLSKDIITAQIAARAVSETSSGMLQLIPDHLVTHELCLSSVKRKGTTLEFVPPALRSAEVCMAAIANDWTAIGWVPPALQQQTCTSLIDATMAAAAKAGKPVSGTRWHGLRAWLRMQSGDVEGALEDARAGLDHVLYPIQARFQLAWCHRELGNIFDSALEAATLLQMGHFTPEFGVDITWLGPESKATLAKADEADLLRGLHTHPLALSKVPQRRITPAMAEVAVRASPKALEFVPKKLMTPELRALAAR